MNRIFFYNKLSDYFKKKFGEKTYKISVNANLNCPNRDGTLSTEGCIFCNNKSFSGVLFPNEILSNQIKLSIDLIKSKNKNANKFIVYFQPNSNTYIDDYERLNNLFAIALKFENVVGLHIGTRPDCINSNIIDILKPIAQKKYICVELGLQSLKNDTLKFLNRNHTVENFYCAVNLLKKISKLDICVHLIIRVQTDTKNDIINFAKQLSDIKIQGVKLHNLQIVKNTTIEKMFFQNKIKLIDYDEYLDTVVCFLENLSDKIIIHRLIGEVNKDYLIAPFYNKTKSDFLRDVENLFKSRNSYQGIFVKYD